MSQKMLPQKKWIDNRDWVAYNEKLVKRGELLLSLDFLDTWDQELNSLNQNKVGRRYQYPWTFIKFLMFIHIIFGLPYRQLEGFVRRLSELVPQVKPIDYTNIWKRGTKLDIDLAETIAESDEPVVIAIDSSGIKVANRGDWIREEWDVHRGWIKVHIAVNAETKEIIGIEVTDEHVGDCTMFEPVIEQAENNLKDVDIEKVLDDGAYDANDNFDILNNKNIVSGIKIRQNASTETKGSPSRKKYVKEFKDLKYTQWRDKYDYGQRWAVECVFSAVKRITGEFVTASKTENMLHEAMLKFVFYNILINMT